jgi:hypothetical protein
VNIEPHTPENDRQNRQNSPWLLAGADLDAVLADDRLIAALARGEVPDPSDPLGRTSAALVREVVDGGAR